MPGNPALPRVSVIIPAYDRQGQLTAAVQSVASQKGLGHRFEVELIIVDDASPTPQTASTAEPGLSLHIERHESNQGPAAARNTGISLATGDYVAFLDSDDIWRPAKLEAQMAKAVSLPKDELWALATGFRIKRSRTRKWEDLVPVDLAVPADFLKGCRHSPGSTSFLPRRVFDRVGLLDAALDRLEDYDWYARFGKAGGKLYSVPDILADIDPSNSVARDKVLTAIQMIDAKLTRSGLTPEETALMRAYLNFERGATLMRAERPLLGAYSLVRSFLLAPRLQPHLAPISAKPAS